MSVRLVDIAPTLLCRHRPACPDATAPDAMAAKIVAQRLEQSGYALLCNGLVVLAGERPPLCRPAASAG